LRPPEPSRAEAGFSLLEVLVAFVIAAMALAGLVEGVRRSLAAGEVTAHQAEALSRARSRLAAALVQPLQQLDQQGEDGNGFRWHLHVGVAAASPAATLFDVRVAVSWGGPEGRLRQVELATRHLGPGR
jgi:general secretion pathway protein I